MNSKTKAFEEIKFKSPSKKDWTYAQGFYQTLHKVINYQSSVNLLKNKTFFFENKAIAKKPNNNNNETVLDKTAYSNVTSITSKEQEEKSQLREKSYSIYTVCNDLEKIENNKTLNDTSISEIDSPKQMSNLSMLDAKLVKSLNINTSLEPELVEVLNTISNIVWSPLHYSLFSKYETSNEDTRKSLLTILNKNNFQFETKSECKY